ncbi:hypothetical protein U3C50_001530 [Providencia rettgeri]|nr:hypothetical protein [Providencia rettgeri]
MKNNDVFIPKFELDSNTVKLVNRLAGKTFSNQDVHINFKGIEFDIEGEKRFITLRIEFPGVSGQFYLSYDELERFIGVDIELLSQDYIGYIFNKNIGQYGIKFKSFVNCSEILLKSHLISAIASLQDKSCSIYFSTEDLRVDTNFLTNRMCDWPSTLTLSLDFMLSQVTLDTQKLDELSHEDLVLLCNR